MKQVVDFLFVNWAYITGAVALIIYIASIIIKNYFPKELPELEKAVDTTNQTLSATGDFVKTVEALEAKKP